MNRPEPPPECQTPILGSELSDECFAAICDLLKSTRGFDLSQYKDRCAKRRIAKRMRALHINKPAAYLEKISADRDELDALLAVLTIHVSQFFRNPSTFRALEQLILPSLLDRLRNSGRSDLRIWSVGCAGGEEPYSLALLLAELNTQGLRVSLLGTDINQDILARARRAVFPAQRLAEVPPPVLERYFHPEGQDFRLCDEIRRQVEFRRHDILGEDDYPAADLTLCRNVLIYFSREEQDRILKRFAATVPAGGILVLGRTETLLGETRDLFLAESAAERIYRRKSD